MTDVMTLNVAMVIATAKDITPVYCAPTDHVISSIYRPKGSDGRASFILNTDQRVSVRNGDCSSGR